VPESVVLSSSLDLLPRNQSMFTRAVRIKPSHGPLHQRTGAQALTLMLARSSLRRSTTLQSGKASTRDGHGHGDRQAGKGGNSLFASAAYAATIGAGALVAKQTFEKNVTTKNQSATYATRSEMEQVSAKPLHIGPHTAKCS
jgi:hypothetical protein